jgi:glycosyltransferase involved in cell wall biosynthesis
LRAWLGIPDDRPFLLCLGLLEKRKNIEGAIAAWEALRERGVDCALAVVGKDGEGADGIRRRAEASRWARDIALPGRAPAELLSALYAEAAAVLFLSWYEGFGLPVLEAMAAGTPVLVSDRASLPEVWGPAPVDSPRLVVDPQRPEAAADLLQPILLDPALRRRCIEHGVSRVRAFTWEKTARQTWAAWTSSLQRSGRVRAAESNPKATSP